MPTVLQVGPYRFTFFSSDSGERPHIHVYRDAAVAKFWLTPVSVTHNRGFPAHELNNILSLVEQHRDFLLEKWHDYFDS